MDTSVDILHDSSNRRSSSFGNTATLSLETTLLASTKAGHAIQEKWHTTCTPSVHELLQKNTHVPLNLSKTPVLDLTIHNLLWSKGPLRNEYSTRGTETPSHDMDWIRNLTEENNIVFIRNGSTHAVHDLYIFSTLLHLLPTPIILITSDGDKSMPCAELPYTYQLLQSPMIVAWYTQNYNKSIIHPKLKHYPIGFDLHTSQWFINDSVHDKIKYMVYRRRLSPTHTRIAHKILNDTYHSKSHPERAQLFHLVKKNPHIDFLKKVPFRILTDMYNQYNFVLSPRGNGLDCHRTWELLLAGVIVITKTSPLDDMYRQHNLPVVILKEWDELNHNLPHKLKEWYKEHLPKTSMENIFERLTVSYWLMS
jgi:hypothetical protein